MIKKLVSIAFLISGSLCAMQENAEKVDDEQILRIISRLQASKQQPVKPPTHLCEDAPKRISKSESELPLGSQGYLPEDDEMRRRVCFLVGKSVSTSALLDDEKDGLIEAVLYELLNTVLAKNASEKAASEQTGRGSGYLIFEGEQKGNVVPHDYLTPPIYFP